jgi:hypothetical protein
MQATGLVNDHWKTAGNLPILEEGFTNATTLKPKTLNFQTNFPYICFTL